MEVDKEQEAVLNLLQHFISMRGIKCDGSVLRNLIWWAWEKGLISGANTAFELSVWEALGKALWDEICSGRAGAKKASKYSTHWKLIKETLQSMKAERQAAASADLTPGAESNSFSTRISVPISTASPLPEPPKEAQTAHNSDDKYNNVTEAQEILQCLKEIEQTKQAIQMVESACRPKHPQLSDSSPASPTEKEEAKDSNDAVKTLL